MSQNVVNCTQQADKGFAFIQLEQGEIAVCWKPWTVSLPSLQAEMPKPFSPAYTECVTRKRCNGNHQHHSSHKHIRTRNKKQYITSQQLRIRYKGGQGKPSNEKGDTEIGRGSVRESREKIHPIHSVHKQTKKKHNAQREGRKRTVVGGERATRRDIGNRNIYALQREKHLGWSAIHTTIAMHSRRRAQGGHVCVETGRWGGHSGHPDSTHTTDSQNCQSKHIAVAQ